MNTYWMRIALKTWNVLELDTSRRSEFSKQKVSSLNAHCIAHLFLVRLQLNSSHTIGQWLQTFSKHLVLVLRWGNCKPWRYDAMGQDRRLSISQSCICTWWRYLNCHVKPQYILSDRSLTLFLLLPIKVLPILKMLTRSTMVNVLRGGSKSLPRCVATIRLAWWIIGFE